ncbi:hypothetical protein P1P75_10890 [Streptomyces sp. ID05-39B]|uniref:hypothetical protein n=1 Tax=Streptomyces sp. ID05-39B TaxID=3028664 RepID=UPI0029B65F25|nr:hypothetical protein [Streptomyces sp. ID05-39B]MDX3526934.1 hypothetical protein [Streptomyces sp. ID05-39B]
MGAPDRDIVTSGSCWPLAVLTDDDGAVVGCLLPKAPAKFLVDLTAPSGRSAVRYLEIDWLANPNAVLEKRGLPAQSLRARAEVCQDLATVAAVLERHGLVYSDWSYSNSFWSPKDCSAYVIDIDGCVPTSGPNVHQPGWEDPLTSSGDDADTYVDRYRLALLVARCLTGRRRAEHVMSAVRHGTELDAVPELRDILLRMLLSPEREERPSVQRLQGVLRVSCWP